MARVRAVEEVRRVPPGTRSATGPTMRDVAQEAGVSKALVSIVFRGAAGASEQTRQRVFAAADRIGYRANRTASLLARSRTRHLGVTVSLHSGFHADLVEGILAAADDAGYQIVLSPVTGRHGEAGAIATALEFRCEALLLLGPELAAAELLDLIGDVPTVCVGRQLASDRVDIVRTADDDGMELVVDHLVGLGHRRIAHVDGGSGEIASARRSGFERAVRRHRLLGRSTVIAGGQTEADGRRAAQILLARDEPPTAVAAFNDPCALGVLDALSAAGLRVPEDVSVTGYDDSPVAQLAAISLTSVSQEAAEQARWAVTSAVEQLDGGRRERRELVLTPRLVVRGSSSAAPGWVLRAAEPTAAPSPATRSSG